MILKYDIILNILYFLCIGNRDILDTILNEFEIFDSQSEGSVGRDIVSIQIIHMLLSIEKYVTGNMLLIIDNEVQPTE